MVRPAETLVLWAVVNGVSGTSLPAAGPRFRFFLFPVISVGVTGCCGVDTEAGSAGAGVG